jgi:hypothetical protein
MSERVPFYEQGYLKHNLRRGAVYNRSGTKMCMLPSELLLGLHQTLEEEVGEMWHDVMGSIGRIWGRRVAERFERETTEYYNRPLHELPMAEFARLLEGFFRYNGWGLLKVDFSLASSGLLGARLENSAYVEIIGAADRPVDNIVAGLLGAMGAPCCRFVVGISARLRSVPDWVASGMSHEVVLGQLGLVQEGIST